MIKELHATRRRLSDFDVPVKLKPTFSCSPELGICLCYTATDSFAFPMLNNTCSWNRLGDHRLAHESACVAITSVLLLCFVTAIPAANLPKADLEFLRGLTSDVIAASSVPPGSNGGGNWQLTNTCGFTLITPGMDTYHAFLIRDLSMSAESGLISAAALSNHLVLICKAQNGPFERHLANNLHLPPWAIPDHINYDGQAVFYPGMYASGENQGDG